MKYSEKELWTAIEHIVDEHDLTETEGGYKPERDLVGDYVVIAHCDHDGAPRLVVLHKDEVVLQWREDMADRSLTR